MLSKNDETPLAATSGASESTNHEQVIDMKNTLAKKIGAFTIFKFDKSEIRIIDKSGEPWFVAADICKALELSNPSKSVAALDEDEKDVLNSDPNLKLGSAGNGPQSMNIVSESGMYTLVLRCRDAVNKGSVPHAFRKWVTAEVLPAIRKHGIYEKPVTEKKNHQSTATQLTPLRQTAERLIATGLGKIYPDIWKYVHSKFEVKHIHQLTPSQVGEAVEYLNGIEGEFLGKGEPDPKREDVAPSSRRAPVYRFHINMVVEDTVTGEKETLKGGANSATEIVNGTAKKFGIHVFDMMPVPVTAFR